MPIRPFLNGEQFDAETLRILGVAFAQVAISDLTPSSAHVRFAPKADINRRERACPLRAKSGCEQSQQRGPAFDHFVSAQHD
jgi:hypothetical protein